MGPEDPLSRVGREASGSGRTSARRRRCPGGEDRHRTFQTFPLARLMESRGVLEGPRRRDGVGLCPVFSSRGPGGFRVSTTGGGVRSERASGVWGSGPRDRPFVGQTGTFTCKEIMTLQNKYFLNLPLPRSEVLPHHRRDREEGREGSKVDGRESWGSGECRVGGGLGTGWRGTKRSRIVWS